MFLNVQSVVRPKASDIIAAASSTANGQHGSGDNPQIGSDGRYVVFESSADNLVAGDTNGVSDIFLKDLRTGAITRVSTAADGTQANFGSSTPQISADGRYVLFESSANNLVAGDTNGSADIFRKDLLTGAIICISTSTEGAHGNSWAARAQFSPDGRYVLFESQASNLVAGDTNNSSDVFLKDLQTGTLTRISTKADGQQSNFDSNSAQFSSDGRYVVFESGSTDLVSGDTNVARDIFLKDLRTGAITLVSTAANGQLGNANSYNPQISADGRYVLFEGNDGNLVPGDTNGVRDIFVKDLWTGAITRVSTAADGQQANGSGSYSAQFSPDGRYVVFESNASNLVAGDTNGKTDVFMKDLWTGAITRVSTTADGQQGSGEGYGAHFSADGRYMTFASSSALVPGDTNNQYDVFRIDLHYKANATAIVEGRYLEVNLGVGSASSATIAWGDGTSSTVTPSSGSAAFSHTYASVGAKAASVTLVDGALTWVVPHVIDTASGSMVRNTALADTLSGGAGSDVLTGDAFSNILLASAGNDVLNGDAGNDRLTGGLGKDTMKGGAGRDVFVFDDRDTSASKSRADYMMDFSGRLGDRIDLRAVDANTKKSGDQNFSFIGKHAFSHAGQVRYEKTKSYTYVYLNTDNDKAAEAVIKIKGSLDLQKSWFVL